MSDPEPSERLDLSGIIAFLGHAERLKSVWRGGWTGDRAPESTAAHSWRMALLALLMVRSRPELDALQVLALALVHDLGEAYLGDVPALDQGDGDDRSARERAEVARMAQSLPPAFRDWIIALIDDYTMGASAEAVFVKGIDKVETVLQHTDAPQRAGFDYGFNLAYGRTWTDRDPEIAALRALADRRTRAKM